MRIRKFGKLRMKDPEIVTSGSAKRKIFICDCGKETEKQIHNVVSGVTRSCGRCNEISAEDMTSRKFGKLRMKFPRAILLGSNKKEIWVCDCGKELIEIPNKVCSKRITSCGRCNEISAEEMSVRKFGKLRMKFPKAVIPWSRNGETWICDCGRETTKKTCYVISGDTKSCGNCRDSVHEWYLKNKEHLSTLRCPIKPEDFPSGGPIPLEIIRTTVMSFKCQCSLCGKIYYPRLNDIKLNNGGLTCGCSSYRISSGQKDISLFIESLGFETELEYRINRLSYDIYVPSANLLIEYDGKRWHSMRGSKERDERKEQNAVKCGYKFFRISEDEWMKSRKRVENQLKFIINP